MCVRMALTNKFKSNDDEGVWELPGDWLGEGLLGCVSTAEPVIQVGDGALK